MNTNKRQGNTFSQQILKSVPGSFSPTLAARPEPCSVKSKLLTQILVRRITTVVTPDDVGRYVTLETLSSLRPDVFHGVEEAHFRDLKGVEVKGKIVSMKEEIAMGHFPPPPTGLLIVDTKPVREQKVARMQTGGPLGTCKGQTPMARR